MSWDSRGLTIKAFNSSLDEILHQVAHVTGATLEGLARDPIRDQRVFGSYGPGPGCEVLSKLLEGTGLNVLMIGTRDADAPLKIVLSARSPNTSQVAVNHPNRSVPRPAEPERPPEPEPQTEISPDAQRAQSTQDPFNVGGSARDPKEFMQEILQRQQVIDQQQQDQQNRQQP